MLPLFSCFPLGETKASNWDMWSVDPNHYSCFWVLLQGILSLIITEKGISQTVCHDFCSLKVFNPARGLDQHNQPFMNHLGHQAEELELQEGVRMSGVGDEAKVLQTLRWKHLIPWRRQGYKGGVWNGDQIKSLAVDNERHERLPGGLPRWINMQEDAPW